MTATATAPSVDKFSHLPELAVMPAETIDPFDEELLGEAILHEIAMRNIEGFLC